MVSRRAKREEDERQSLECLGIKYVRFKSEDDWPKHLFKTFEAIHDLVSYHPRDFINDAFANHELWCCEIENQAKAIAAISKDLEEDEVSEMEWRLRIEELFLARFRPEFQCPDCKNLLWTSKIEARIESPCPIADRLEGIWEKKHQSCQCQDKPVSSSLCRKDMKKIFTSRADELILYDPRDSKKLPQKRRPDRIVGFHKSQSWDICLNPVAHWLQGDAVNISIRQTTKYTVLSSKSLPLLFPFLVIEAKSDDGQGFRSCARQTALPIWKMLKIQEELRSQSNMDLEYGGPLVWYIAYRGEEWRLYGCYTLKEDRKDHTIIHEICMANLTEISGALQVLLIIDYIFDWARNIYRPSIKSQLKILEKTLKTELEGRVPRRSTDSDNRSFAGSQQNRTRDMSVYPGSPGEVPPDGNLVGSIGNFDIINMESADIEVSAPCDYDSESETANSLEYISKFVEETKPSQESIDEHDLGYAESSLIKRPDSNNEVPELGIALTTSPLTLHRKYHSKNLLCESTFPSVKEVESSLREHNTNCEPTNNSTALKSPPLRHNNSAGLSLSHDLSEIPTYTCSNRVANHSPYRLTSHDIDVKAKEGPNIIIHPTSHRHRGPPVPSHLPVSGSTSPLIPNSDIIASPGVFSPTGLSPNAGRTKRMKMRGQEKGLKMAKVSREVKFAFVGLPPAGELLIIDEWAPGYAF